jgi:hypothetical protein
VLAEVASTGRRALVETGRLLHVIRDDAEGELGSQLAHGVGRELHEHLVAGLTTERITLLVRPDAPAAQHAYARWGYRRVGQIQPFSDAPTYDAMINDSRLSAMRQP